MKKIYTGILSIFFFALAANATIHTINVEDFEFSPSELNVTVGDTVRWEWDNSAGPHTTTSMAVPTDALTWDAPIDSAHHTFDYVVMVLGTYEYTCSIHTTMDGSFVATAGVAIVEFGTPEWFNVTSTIITNNEINATFNLSNPDKIDVQLVDLSGNVLADLSDENYQSGIHSESYRILDIPTGIYLLRASGLNGILTKKLLIR